MDDFRSFAIRMFDNAKNLPARQNCALFAIRVSRQQSRLSLSKMLIYGHSSWPEVLRTWIYGAYDKSKVYTMSYRSEILTGIFGYTSKSSWFQMPLSCKKIQGPPFCIVTSLALRSVFRNSYYTLFIRTSLFWFVNFHISLFLLENISLRFNVFKLYFLRWNLRLGC